LKIQDQFLTKHAYFTKTSNATRNKLKAEVLEKIKSALKKLKLWQKQDIAQISYIFN